MESGLNLGLVSVLPATTAYVIFPALHSAQLSLEVLAFAGLWAISYVGVTQVTCLLKK